MNKKENGQDNIYPIELVNYAKHLHAKDDVIDWIKKRVSHDNNNFNLGEAEHVIDYLVSDDRPKRLDRATYSQMKDNSIKWINKLQKRGTQSRYNNEKEGVDFETILTFPNSDFRFVKLISKSSYEREGNLMSHCVASYFGRDVEIYSLRDGKNQPHCTIEKDVQIKGKGNGHIHPKYIEYVVSFLEWTGMKVKNNEMKNLGYEKVPFHSYLDLNKSQSLLFRDEYIYKRDKDKLNYQENVKIFTNLGEAVSYRNPDHIVLFDGDADFRNSEIKRLGQLKSIGGNAYFNNSKITSLGNLESIGGDANFENSKITSLGQLESIGGYADFRKSEITSLGQLKSIGGNAFFGYSKITDLGNLKSIRGNAYFRNSKLTSLGQLKSIGGSAYFGDSKITSLGQLESIGRNTYFGNSKITDLGQLESIGDYADFENSEITDLGQLKSIGGYAYFSYSEITSLGNLESIGGYANFYDSKITNLGNLKSIGSSANFRNSKITSIGQLKSIGGDANFRDSNLSEEDWKDIEIKGQICC